MAPPVLPGQRLPLCGSMIKCWLVGVTLYIRLHKSKAVAGSLLPGWGMALLDWSVAVNMYES